MLHFVQYSLHTGRRKSIILKTKEDRNIVKQIRKVLLCSVSVFCIKFAKVSV